MMVKIIEKWHSRILKHFSLFLSFLFFKFQIESILLFLLFHMSRVLSIHIKMISFLPRSNRVGGEFCCFFLLLSHTHTHFFLLLFFAVVLFINVGFGIDFKSAHTWLI